MDFYTSEFSEENLYSMPSDIQWEDPDLAQETATEGYARGYGLPEEGGNQLLAVKYDQMRRRRTVSREDSTYNFTKLSTFIGGPSAEDPADNRRDVWRHSKKPSANEIHRSGHGYSSFFDKDLETDEREQARDGEQELVFEDTADKEWNTLFQECVNIHEHGATSLSARCAALWALASDFNATALTYASIIITELCLPPSRRSIKPADVGGTAGGSKYIVQGILFKVALDVEIADGLFMYGGRTRRDDLAMKAANKELTGLGALWSSSVDDLYGPLMTIIDYKGFRVVALSLLPIDKSTILYGSNDGGATVHADNEVLNAKLKDLGEQLNLKEHDVGVKNPKKLHMPGDIEAHEGHDGRFYLLDFARLMPPEAPLGQSCKGLGRWMFYRTFRPEFLKHQYQTALCSDAFTNFDCSPPEIQKQNRADIEEATRHLHTVVIAEYAITVSERYEKFAKPRGGTRCAILEDKMARGEVCSWFSGACLHPRGINIRHLGLLRSNLVNKDCRNLCLSVCCARAIKNIIHSRMRILMRSLKTTSDKPFEELWISTLNLTLGNDPNVVVGGDRSSSYFWSTIIKQELKNTFGCVLNEQERDSAIDLRSLIDYRALFHTLFSELQVKLTPLAQSHFWNALKERYCPIAASRNRKGEFVFVQGDFESLGLRMRTLPVVYLSRAITILSSIKPGMEARAKWRTMLKCEDAYRRTMQAIPYCPIVARELGKLYVTMANCSESDTDFYYQQACEMFSMTLFDMGIEMPDSMHMWAATLEEYAAYKRGVGENAESRRLLTEAAIIQKRLEESDVQMPLSKCRFVSAVTEEMNQKQ